MGQGSSCSKLEDRYHVQKVKLGRGSFGIVWRAVDKESNAIVAVKQLDKSVIAELGVKRRDVEREITMMKSCMHENIIRLFEIFEDKSSTYLALEYCDGGSFGDKVKGRGRSIQEDEAADWMLQILSAIAALHSQSICHRDIKPENFMFSGNTLKLTDFGMATPVQPRQLLVEKCGTPAFMAPEQHLLPRKSNGYSFPVDLWAAGILMYMLMEAHHPFINTKGKKEKLEEVQLMKGQLFFSGERSTSFLSAFSHPSSPQEEDRFSDAAKRFCRCLVCPNPATRFNAKAALHDPWLIKVNRETCCGNGAPVIVAPDEEPNVWVGQHPSGYDSMRSLTYEELDEEPDEEPDEPDEEPRADWMWKLMRNVMVECGCPDHRAKVRSQYQAAGQVQVPSPPGFRVLVSSPTPPPDRPPAESHACKITDNDN